MKNTKRKGLFIAVAILLSIATLSTGTAYATTTNRQEGGFFSRWFSSWTWPWQNHASSSPATSTPPAHDRGRSDERKASTTSPMVMGVVTSVSGSTITMTSMRASSTLSIQVDANGATIIKLGKGTSTSEASLSDITEGTHIAVKGTISTDSTSIDAETIRIMPAEGTNAPTQKGMGKQRMGSSTKPGEPMPQGGPQGQGAQGAKGGSQKK